MDIEVAVERRIVFYSGRVQGVGFRFTAHRIARGYCVSGFVRNLPDGRVELVAEGATAELDAFLRQIQTEMDGKIEHADTQNGDADGRFHSFEIRS